jgi:hypothetical protein
MKMLTRVSVSVLALGMCLLSACASAPTAEQIASADYGSYPSSYEQTIKQSMLMSLKDPDSAQYQHVKGPSQG